MECEHHRPGIPSLVHLVISAPNWKMFTVRDRELDSDFEKCTGKATGGQDHVNREL